MNKRQQDFLERLALRIPRLFDAIAQGNVKSEYIIGVRSIGARHVRLKLVAEVVDPGANPLATHGQMSSDIKGTLRSVDLSTLNTGTDSAGPVDISESRGVVPDHEAVASGAVAEPGSAPASRRKRSRKR